MYVGMQVYRQYVHIETHYFTSFHLILKKSHFGVRKPLNLEFLKDNCMPILHASVGSLGRLYAGNRPA